MSKKILVIDDDTDILGALIDMLEFGGYRVDTIPNADHILEKISSYQPVLILLDIMLSGKDGRLVCRQLKNNPSTQAIPIIMISAAPARIEDILNYGAEDFVAKPFDMDDLFNRIARQLN